MTFADDEIAADEEGPQPADLGRRGFLRGAALLTAAALPAVAACSTTSTTPPAPSSPGVPPMPEVPKPASGESAAHGWAIHEASTPLRPFAFRRRGVSPNDVRVDIKYAGVCHSDIHTGHGDWLPLPGTLVPGHEITGIVAEVGSAVARFKPGDRVAVGTVVDSCGHCSECDAGFEQYCLRGNTYTYGAPSTPERDPGGYTQGGYSTSIVVRDHFVYTVPDGLDLAQAAPILCAGATVWSPMRAWGVQAGWRVGIVGVGGLGHIGIQLAKEIGAEVVAFTTSPDKVADATKFGASTVVVNENKDQLQSMAKSFDFIIDTIPYAHDLEPYFPLLKRMKTFCRVGAGKLTTPNQIGQFSMFGNQLLFGSSNTGNVKETQELINLCAARKIGPQVQVVPIDQINDIWQKVYDKKARYRYVIDASTIKAG